MTQAIPRASRAATTRRRLGAALGGIALAAGSLSLPAAASAASDGVADTVFLNGEVMEFSADGGYLLAGLALVAAGASALVLRRRAGRAK